MSRLVYAAVRPACSPVSPRGPDRASRRGGGRAGAVAWGLCLALAAPLAAAAGAAHGDDAPARAQPSAAPRAAAVPERPATADALTLEQLRQRLVDRVGTVRSPSPRSAVLAVTTRPDAAAPGAAHAAPSGTHAAPAAKPARAEKRPAAKAHGGASGHAHWGYAGEGGPQEWGDLDASFSTCARGTRQSPIDIREGIRVELDPIHFDYRPTAFKVIDNGHTVQVNLAPVNSIQIGGRRYELLQFHFHRPSEERINGRQFDMVAHLVHKDVDGRLAVVAVLIEQGRLHPAVQMVWNNLPLERGEENAAQSPIDLQALLPEDRRYYTYMGSLTTPPCTEGVLWMVMKEPVQVSPDQVMVFSRLYPMNARPIQAVSGRLIKESN